MHMYVSWNDYESIINIATKKIKFFKWWGLSTTVNRHMIGWTDRLIASSNKNNLLNTVKQ